MLVRCAVIAAEYRNTDIGKIMIGLGTAANVAAIVAGGFAGMIFGARLSDRMRESVTLACGLSVVFMSIASAMAQMLKINNGALESGKTMLIVACLAAGTLVGEFIDLNGKIERFGEWLKIKSGNAGERRFVEAFVMASMTVCVGAMAVVGSLEDGMYGNHSILFAKAVLDCIIILVMTASMGKGCIFSAIPVGVFQGSVTVLAVFLKGMVSDAAMANLSLVGNLLIFCIGVNLVWSMKIRVANMLPALLFAVAAAYI